jgi:hypothetical protein
VLARLDAIRGVNKSFANQSGTMVRVQVVADANLEQIMEDLTGVLQDEAGRSPERVPVDESMQLLEHEEWRDATRVAELSMIEFRTLTVRAVFVLVGIVALGFIIRWRFRQRKTQTQ